MTALLCPWKNSLSQDDGTYAWQVLELLKHTWEVHPANVAAIIPQTFLGAAFVSLFQFLKPLAALNILTWILFLLTMGITLVWTRSRALFIISIFAYPLWIQYGASFLYEMYSAFFIVSLLFLIDQKSHNKTSLILIFILSFLLPLQVQSTLIIPASLGLSYCIFSPIRRKLGFTLMSGASLGLITYLALPHGLFQDALTQAILSSKPDLKQISLTFLQLLLGLGSLLFPFSKSIKSWNWRLWSIATILFIASSFLFYSHDVPILSVGILFTQYMPRPIALLTITIGSFGLVGVAPLIIAAFKDQTKRLEIMTSALILVTFFGLYAIKGINDIRIALIFVFIFIFCVRSVLHREQTLGDSKLFTWPLFGLSLFLNSYNIETNEARWRLAEALENQGIPKKQISAGYGRDVFYLEAECIRKTYQKMDPHLFSEFLLKNVPRCYNSEWIPQYVIKPYKIFGKKLSLKINQQPGQDQSPQQIYSYHSLGFHHELAVYENHSHHLPQCFR